MPMVEMTHPRHGWTVDIDERVADLAIALWHVTDDHVIPSLVPGEPDDLCSLLGIEQETGEALLTAMVTANSMALTDVSDMFSVEAMADLSNQAPPEFMIVLELVFPASAIPQVERALERMASVTPPPRHRERPRRIPDPIGTGRRALDL